MIRLLMIADDFTGALDTGVQLAAGGAEVRVITDPSTDFRKYEEEAEVLVVDAETRHLPPEEAYDIVKSIVLQALRLGALHIFKKTDSAMRGNVGAELSALLEISGESCLPFIPAFPQIGRITKNGMHYIDGVPVSESVFGKDPFNPVRHSLAAEIIGEQTLVPVHSLKPEDSPEKPGILVYDAETVKDLEKIGGMLSKTDHLRIMAGCAGFGSILPQLLGIGAAKAPARPNLGDRLLVICGSVNPITQAQLDWAEKAGFTRIRLAPEEKLNPDFWNSPAGKEKLNFLGKALSDHPLMIVDSNDPGDNSLTEAFAGKIGLSLEEVRLNIARSLGSIAEALFPSPDLGTFLITGGDTLLQCMKCIGASELTPICELSHGVVLSSFSKEGRERFVITKSGGFGNPELFTELMGTGSSQKAEQCAKPIIGITMGDPAGNGPEITIKALSHPDLYDRCRPIVIGDAKMLEQATRFVGHPEIKIHPCEKVSDALFQPGIVDVYHMDLIEDVEKFELGKVSIEGGNAAFQSVRKVIELALAGEVDATCTNALNKEAMNKALEFYKGERSDGYTHFDGHTEIYAVYTGTKTYCMMLAHKDLRVVHVSTHVSLREACNRVKKDRVLEIIRMAHKACADMGIEVPKVAVAGLNPHCGENGLFGTEEIEEISPAVEAARAEGINAIGPIPPDSVFSEALGGWYDIVVCMYHDQGHIPLKTVGFVYDREAQNWKAVEGVNVTLGLPIIRTSVDHGTGFALAGKGTSNELSLINAIDYAIRMAENKQG